MTKGATPAMMTPDLLRSCRLALGFSQLKMAQALGVQKETVYRWEAGRAPIGDPERLAREVAALLADRAGEIGRLWRELTVTEAA